MNRLTVLARIGIGPLWGLRAPCRDNEVSSPPNFAGKTNEALIVSRPLEAHCADEVAPSSVKETQIECADGIAPQISAVGPAASAVIKAHRADWPELVNAIGACRACRLSEQRSQAVPGVGDRCADWLFVGEGPGAEEDLRGEPFVGQAGKLLDAMLAGLGIARGLGVYIANAVKCRPPNNRTPEPDEIEACFPYLQRQIELIRPRVIVALGRPAAQALLKQEIRIGAARGQVFRFGEIPVVVTYHPAYLLRNPADKGKAWADLCFARKTLASSPPKVKETV